MTTLLPAISGPGFGTRVVRALCVPIFALFALANASATMVEYEVQALGGDDYRYIYTITNDDPVEAIAEFEIYFPTALYLEGSLVEQVPQALRDDSWIPIVIDPAVGETRTIFNLLNFDVAIDPGMSLGGFAVDFTWLGAGLPGSQAYKLIGDFSDFEGDTVAVSAVPLPAGFVLLAGALGGLALGSRRRAR